MEQEYFTYKELAEYLRVSVGTIQNWKNFHRLPYIQHKNVIRFKKDQVNEWFEKGQIVWEINKTCQNCKKSRDMIPHFKGFEEEENT